MAPTGFSVDTSALRSDAKKWMKGAQEMESAALWLAQAELGRDQFGRKADNYGATDAYRQVQARVVQFMREAGGQFGEIQLTLGKCADIYEREDRKGAHKFNQLGPRS